MGSYHRGGTFKSVILRAVPANRRNKIYLVTEYYKVLLLFYTARSGVEGGGPSKIRRADDFRGKFRVRSKLLTFAQSSKAIRDCRQQSRMIV